MGESSWVEIGLGMVTIFGGVIGWLLANKDEKQAKEIAILFAKHDVDVQRLQDLEVKIAANHPDRQELTDRFNKLDATINVGFASFSDRLDKLFALLFTHEKRENGQ